MLRKGITVLKIVILISLAYHAAVQRRLHVPVQVVEVVVN